MSAPDSNELDGDPSNVVGHVRMGVGVLLILVVAAVAYMTYAARSEPPTSPAQHPPATPAATLEDARTLIDVLTLAPDQLQRLNPAEARSWNDALPVSREPVLPAPPFIAPSTDPADYARALDCLTAAIYYEAGNETVTGKMAVAQVVLNRVRHPVYPKTVCGVVFEGSERKSGCQFTFTCDNAIASPPSQAGWSSAAEVAQAALNGLVLAQVGAATHYHADYVAPYWAQRLTKIGKIGVHIFYRFPGAWSDTSALRGVYVGGEPIIAKMFLLPSSQGEPTPDAVTTADLALSAPAIELEPLTLEPLQVDLAPGQRIHDSLADPSDPTDAPVTPPPPPVSVRPENPLVETRRDSGSRLARPDRW